MYVVRECIRTLSQSTGNRCKSVDFFGALDSNWPRCLFPKALDSHLKTNNSFLYFAAEYIYLLNIFIFLSIVYAT